ncbi:MAG: hypothetical protein K2O01_00590 [Bacteroidales bacterium]|nr:hypothetical protein [Bacteroidales bacterium]
MLEGDALLRAAFGVDPSVLSDAEWVSCVQQALWLEYFRVNLIGRVFTPQTK